LCSPAKAPTAHRPKKTVEGSIVLFISALLNKKKERKQKRGRIEEERKQKSDNVPNTIQQVK
jgi:hypothetical protein